MTRTEHRVEVTCDRCGRKGRAEDDCPVMGDLPWSELRMSWNIYPDRQNLDLCPDCTKIILDTIREDREDLQAVEERKDEPSVLLEDMKRRLGIGDGCGCDHAVQVSNWGPVQSSIDPFTQSQE